MGDSVSISFIKDGQESVAFFSHWDGALLVNTANTYVKVLKEEIAEEQMRGYPLSRLEPNTVMVDFIRDYLNTRMGYANRVKSNYCLGKDQDDGDNSDNGHYRITL